MGFSVVVPFGRGLDRASGASSGDEADFRDLRNVALGEGWAELRRGLERRTTLAVAGGLSTLAADTFLDAEWTELASHVPTGPDAGLSWVMAVGGSNGFMVTDANRVRGASGGYVKRQIRITKGSAWSNDQGAECDLVFKTDTADDYNYVACRTPDAATGGYYFGYSTANNRWEMYRGDGHDGTLLGQSAFAFPAADTVRRIKILAVGDQITAYVDGVAVVGPITDATHAAGSPALYYTGGVAPDITQGVHFDNFAGIGMGGGAAVEVTDVIAIHPLKSLGVGAAVAYNAETREVSLWLLSADGTTASFVAILYTLSALAPFPRVLTADSYGLLFIAHDEPTFALRQNTKVYDPVLATVANVEADLNVATVGAQPVKFRGVERWLNYIVGWGYGTEDDGDRPEIVRISVAGEPMNWKPEHYFMAGQRGDAVIRCARSGGGLLVHKPTESYLIFGHERSNFGIRLVDERFGIIGSRLSVTVGGVNYRWAVEGPRRSDGGASDDLALPLDIGGPLVEPMADPSSGDYAFAEYFPKQQEIVFCFGRWGYVLHLKNPAALRWSYNEYKVEPACFGTLLDIGGSTLGSPGYPTVNAVVPVPTGLEVEYTASGALTGERVEVWIRNAFSHEWVRAIEQAAVANETIPVLAIRPGVLTEVALRFKKNSLASPAYSGDPSTWPGVSRGATTVPLAPVTGLNVSRVGNTLTLTYVGGATGGQVTAKYEKNINGAGWSTIVEETATTDNTSFDLVDGELSGAGDFRITLTTAWAGPNVFTANAVDLGYPTPIEIGLSRYCEDGEPKYNVAVALGTTLASTLLEYSVNNGPWIHWQTLAPNVSAARNFVPSAEGLTQYSSFRFRARHEQGASISSWTYSSEQVVGVCEGGPLEPF